MNIFAQIIEVQAFSKVTYYSILKEGEKQNMFLQFLNRIAEKVELAEDLQLLKTWLKLIGDKYGAQEQYFRHEQAANALPPPFRFTETQSSLRLYCMRVSENTVILFSGDIKTTQHAQDCPNVGPHFKEALRLTKKIDEAMRERRIQTDWITGKFIIDPDFDIEI